MITKERPNTARQTGRVLEDVKIHVKIKLAVLWVALMFLYIYADIKALFQPGIMEQLDVEQVALQNDTEARIRELTRNNAEKVRESIERSILTLEKQKEKNSRKQSSLIHEPAEFYETASQAGKMFKSTSNEIQKMLQSHPSESKLALCKLLSGLEIGETNTKVVLSSVNHSGPCSSAFAPAPPVGRV